MELTFNTWILALILAVGQGIFLIFLVLSDRKQRSEQSLWLVGILAVFVLTLIDYLGYYTNAHLRFPYLASSYVWLTFLIGPLFLGFLNQTLQGSNAKIKRPIHLIPALLVLSLQTPFYLSNFDTKLQVITGSIPYPNLLGLSDPAWFTLITFSTILHLFIYTSLSFKLLAQKKLKTEGINYKFHNVLIKLFLAYTLSYLIYGILVFTPYLFKFVDYSIALVMAISIYTLAFIGYRKPQIFEAQELEGAIRYKKYKNSALTSAAAMSLKQRLEAFMKTDQPYLDSDLRLPKLAEALEVHPHHLSQVINEQFEQSFSSFINSYRIERAKELLKESELQIIEIAYQTGFNNKTSFNKAFKANTQVTPSSYRKRILLEK